MSSVVVGVFLFGLTGTEVYALFLFINAVQYTSMLAVCVRSIIKNHLVQRVRILMWFGMFYSLCVGLDQWVRAFGRVQQALTKVVSTQSNPRAALFTMILWTLGTFVFLMGISYLSWSGKIDPLPEGQVPKRKGDPK